MAAAGGPASLITQVQQGGPPINTLGGVYISRPGRGNVFFNLKKRVKKGVLIS